MGSPFTNLSPAAEEVLRLAAASADRLNHWFIGTEHLLIALARTGDSRPLALGIDKALARDLAARVELANRPTPGRDPFFTPRMQKLAGLAARAATVRRAPAVEPAHLLLGLLNAGDGVALRFLAERGLAVAALKQEVERQVGPAPSGFVSAGGPTPWLERFGRDLSALACAGRLSPVIGRDAEIRRVAQILMMRKKNNPVLVGAAGVGKTAVAEGLAQQLAAGSLGPELAGRRVVELGIGAIVAGTKYRGEFEERLVGLLGELRANPEIIVFFDELHTLLGSGATAEGGADAANLLKPALARGEVRCLGATTLEEYRRFIERDPAFERRFQPVTIEEPGPESALRMLAGLRPEFERHYRLKISEGAIQEAVAAAVRHLPDRRLPDKAIDLLEQAAARRKLRDGAAADALEAADIAELVGELTGIPVARLAEAESGRLRRMEEELRTRVVGQDAAVSELARTIRAAWMGAGNATRPRGVFLFSGPTGVGKTVLARTLAGFLFGDERKLIRFEMTEYAERSSVTRLIGAPPGCAGSAEGALTGAVRSRPYSVILFDHIDQAHSEVINLLQSVFDEGRLTDGGGRTVDFRHTVIVMTAAISGSERPALGFAPDAESGHRGHETQLRQRLQPVLPPEFLNRIDKVIPFHHLDRPALDRIVALEVKQLTDRLAAQGYELEVSPAATEKLIELGTSERFGARELARIMQRRVMEPVAELVFGSPADPGTAGRVVIDRAADRLTFTLQAGQERERARMRKDTARDGVHSGSRAASV